MQLINQYTYLTDRQKKVKSQKTTSLKNVQTDCLRYKYQHAISLFIPFKIVYKTILYINRTLTILLYCCGRFFLYFIEQVMFLEGAYKLGWIHCTLSDLILLMFSIKINFLFCLCHSKLKPTWFLIQGIKINQFTLSLLNKMSN